MLHQLPCLAGQAIGLVGKGGGKQPRSVQRLHQVMAHGRQEPRLRLAGGFGHALGVGEGHVQLRQFMGALGHPLLQALIGLGQRLFGFAERGDVGEAHDKPAAGHRVADQLDHPAIGEQALGGVRTPLAHPVQATRHVHLRFTGATQAALGVVSNDVCNGPADADQAVRVVEQFQVAPVPGHQLERLVHHADALGDVLNGTLQQSAVELQHFRGFVGDTDHVLQLHFPPFNRRFHHRPRR